MIGSQFGDFRVDSLAGEGAMGIVYRGRDLRLERPVALKVLRRQSDADPDAMERFLREARAAARLSHGNVVTVLQVLDTADQLVIVSEWVEGTTLEGRVYRHPSQWHAAACILRDIGAGLDAAHEAGIVHRDLKGSNILIGPDSHAKICDFGVSSMIETAATGSALVGTPDRIAPEIWHGKPATPRSDIFALGVLAYEMLTGVRPFSSETVAGLCYEITSEPHRPITEANPALPSDTETVLARALAKRPEDRYASASSFVSALNGSIDSELSSGSGRRSVRPPLSRSARSAVLVLALVGLTALGLASRQREPDQLAITHFELAPSLAPSVDLERHVLMTLASLFSAQPSLVVISSQRLKEECALLQSDRPHAGMADLAIEVSKRAHAKWLLHGWIEGTPAAVVMSAEWVEVASGRAVLFARVETLGSEEIEATVRRLGEALRRELASAQALPGLPLPTP